MLLKCEYFKLQTDVLAEDGRRNMKNLKRSSGYFRRRCFSRRSFRIIASKLWMLTYFIAEENKRQKFISYFTSKLIHFIYFCSAVSLAVRMWWEKSHGMERGI